VVHFYFMLSGAFLLEHGLDAGYVDVDFFYRIDLIYAKWFLSAITSSNTRTHILLGICLVVSK
jgi:hypothetical protein